MKHTMRHKQIMKILPLTLIVVVFLSGCGGNGDGQEVVYKNDVITIEDYTVDNLEPNSGSLATISFRIQNNGDHPEPTEVEVYFFEIEPFKPYEIQCERGVSEGNVKCVFERINDEETNALESLDSKMVSMTLKAPDLPPRLSISPTISYSITYHYVGYRKADIPIIDAVTRMRPLDKAAQSDPSYGPIELLFEPPVGSSHKENGKVVKEYWGVMGRPFEVKMKFKNVGSKSLGSIPQVKIPADHVKLELGDNIRKTDELCNFVESGDNLVSDKDIEIPGGRTELTCNFENTDAMQPPESSATIIAEFDYNYTYIRTETFTVKPIEGYEE